MNTQVLQGSAQVELSLNKRRHIVLWLVVAPPLLAVSAYLGRSVSQALWLSPGIWPLLTAVAALEVVALVASCRSGMWLKATVPRITDLGVECSKGGRTTSVAFHEITRVKARENVRGDTLWVMLTDGVRTIRLSGGESLGTARTMIRLRMGTAFTMEVARDRIDWDDCLLVSGIVLTVWSYFSVVYLTLREIAPLAYTSATVIVPAVALFWVVWVGAFSPAALPRRRYDELREGSIVLFLSLVWLAIEFLC